jgi:hypothetical protein
MKGHVFHLQIFAGIYNIYSSEVYTKIWLKLISV